MPNVHIVQCDEPKYLPFARSRLKQLRANGLTYASQQFSVDDVSIHVRKEGEQEYIRISGGATGNIWVLLTIEKTVTGPPATTEAIYGYPAPTTPQTVTRTTKVIRIAQFGVAGTEVVQKAKVVATFTDSVTRTPTVSSYAAPDISHTVPAEFNTAYYLSSVAFSGNMKKCPSAMTVYGGVPTYYSSYLVSGELTQSISATGVVIRVERPDDGNPLTEDFSLHWETTYTSHAVSADHYYTRITYKGGVRDHNYTYSQTNDTFIANPGADSSSSSNSRTGETAYEGASLPSPLYSYSTTVPGQEYLGDTPYVYDVDAKDFVASTGPYVGYTNPSSFYTTAWTWASGPATVNTAPGDPEWDALVGAVPRKRRPHEVGWYKQGHDFIQWGAGVSDPTWTYDRYCTPASQKTFAGGPRAYALDYNHCVHIGGVTGYPASWSNGVAAHKLTLIRQTGTGYALLGNLTILGTLDLAAVDGIGADFFEAFSLASLPVAPSTSHYYDNTRNTVTMAYSTGETDVAHSLKIQIAIDQKALFDPLTEWK